MGRTTALRRELKRVLVPFMESKKFIIDQRHAPSFFEFRRIVNGRVQFFEIQWEQSGKPRFVVNFGHASIKGTICHNERISANEVCAGKTAEYCRLRPGRGSSTRSWFRQDRPTLSALIARNSFYPPELPVQQLIELFPEAEEYWLTGMLGPNSKLIQCPWAKDVVD